MDNIKKQKIMLGPGISFLGCGIAFSVLGLTVLPVVLGMGTAFLALGAILISASRRR